MGKTALVLGGGAPNATYMAGALVAFDEAGVRFDVISTAGAGALVGLLYTAPIGGDGRSALANLVNLGVADAIYGGYPVNFKVFHKPGALAEMWRMQTKANPWMQAVIAHQGEGPAQALAADALQLGMAAASPSDLGPGSLGLCAPPPFLGDLIDFDVLRGGAPAFYLNAYNLSRRRMDIFDHQVISADHCCAALAYPFLYPPYAMPDGDLYYEGAAHDCLNFRALVEHEPAVERIVVFDVLGAEQLMRPPRNLYDAWVLSIIVPLVEIARDDLKLFKALHQGARQLFPVPFEVPEAVLPEVLDWSRSNLSRLYELGYAAAKRYLAGEGGSLLST